MLPEVCRRLDSSRPYRPTTPHGGEDFSGKHEGDRHNWDVWSKGLDYPAYLEDTGRFLSEFGWQAPASHEVLQAYLDSGSLSLKSENFLAHEKQTGGLELMRRLLAIHYPVPDDFRLFVLYAQLNQADALSAAVVHWRSRMFKTSGCLIWQLNDCWPAVSWSLMDYGLNPKAAYFSVKRAFQPIIAPLIIKQGKACIYIVNETPNDIEATLTLRLLDFTGSILYSSTSRTQTSAFTSELALENTLDSIPVLANSFFLVSLESNGKVIYEETKTVNPPKELKLPSPTIKIATQKISFNTFSIQLESNVYTKAVFLRLNGLRGKFENNFFDLLPKRPMITCCILQDPVSVSDFDKAFLLEAYPYNKPLKLSKG